VGIDRRKPLLAMRETVEVLRRLLNMERVTFEGEFHSVNGIELDVVHGRREPREVPIYIGATGPKMMELTGEIADGVVLNYCVPPEYNDKALEMLEMGASKSGRQLEDLDRPQLVVCSVDADRDRALDTSRELLTQYLAQQPHIARASGVPQDVVAEIQSILGWPATHEQIQQAKHLVSDELIQKITASGTPEEARVKVDEYLEHGATCPILYPVGGDVKLLIDTFAQVI
jgi:5,10-methylenetetrahydromethanopterin reductase